MQYSITHKNGTLDLSQAVSIMQYPGVIDVFYLKVVFKNVYLSLDPPTFSKPNYIIQEI